MNVWRFTLNCRCPRVRGVVGFTDCQRIAGKLRALQSEDTKMRLVFAAAALALFAAPSYAQTAPPAAVTPTASSPAAAPAPHHRATMDERFANANTTHDGHLTLAQAKAGYSTVARHFTEIDTAKNGYVTEDNIRAWEKAARERRHEAQQPAATPTKG